MKMNLSIIIPAHNEENRIGRTLEEYGKFFSKQKDVEILVILNACKDNTLDVVKKYKKKYNIIKFLEFERGGKGFAIVEGFKEALRHDSRLIGFVDADMATKPDAYFDLVKNIGNYGGIIASRWVEGSKVSGRGVIKRIFISGGYNLVVRALFLFPYKDTQCGAKLFKREVIKNIVQKIKITQWGFDVDLLYQVRKSGFKVKEQATEWEDKKGSVLDLKKVPMLMFLSALRLRLLNSPLKDLVRLYDKIPDKIKFKLNLK